MTSTKKGIRMIRYSTQPSKEASALKTESPTAPITTTRDINGLNDTDDQLQNNETLQDLDAEDENDN